MIILKDDRIWCAGVMPNPFTMAQVWSQFGPRPSDNDMAQFFAQQVAATCIAFADLHVFPVSDHVMDDILSKIIS